MTTEKHHKANEFSDKDTATPIQAAETTEASIDETIVEDNDTTQTPDEGTNQPTPEQVIESLKAELAQKHEEVLRAKAEGENIRRRAVEERIKTQKFALEGFAGDLLPVMDSLEASLLAFSKSPQTPQGIEMPPLLKSLLDGIEITHKQLVSVLEKNKICAIPTEGAKFDPLRHQAIGVEEAEGEANRIIRELQKGYTLNDRVLRPSMVIISKAKSD